jgi:cytochrome c553
MKTCIALVMAAALGMTAGAVQAVGDPAAGKAKSGACVPCHGPDGISENPLWPNLAGQNAPYLIKQLRAFRDGTRNDPMMSPMAQPLSDKDIEDLAAYYSSLDGGDRE